ncbi:MAG: hypothetical protein LBS00_01085 [Synergistaceae bacterium]|nr:hypothetical protein [Synergistaceae bacterium]
MARNDVLNRDYVWSLVSEARLKIAALIGASPEEIAFVKNTGMSILAGGFA